MFRIPRINATALEPTRMMKLNKLRRRDQISQEINLEVSLQNFSRIFDHGTSGALLCFCKAIYATNAVEFLISVIGTVIRQRTVLTTGLYASKVVGPRTIGPSKNRTMQFQSWKPALSRFAIIEGMRATAQLRPSWVITPIGRTSLLHGTSRL